MKKSQMIVNTALMHKYFVESLKNQITDFTEKIKDNKKYKTNSTKKLVEFKSFIEKRLNLNFKKCLKLDSKEEVKNLFKSKKSLFYKNCFDKIRYCELHLSIIIEAKFKINFFKERIESLKKDLIKYKQYAFIVRMFNEEVSDLIIKEGYKLKLGFKLGEIRIRKRKRLDWKRPINWGESNKTRQAIIDQGDIPYNKETNPDGKKWIIYYNDKYGYYWYWSKYQCYCKNRDSYSFLPTQGPTGNIKKLNQYRKFNPSVELNYKE